MGFKQITQNSARASEREAYMTTSLKCMYLYNNLYQMFLMWNLYSITIASPGAIRKSVEFFFPKKDD